ncbi:MAG: RelA/SpoT AH/RIS domain-containing protein, partial [Pseudomonadota bacterium]
MTLSNGQSVEIITARGAKPNPNWVNYVVTAKARTALKQYLKNLRHEEARELGKRMLNQALADSGSNIRKVPKRRMTALLDEFGLNNTTELYEQLGLGERLASLTVKQLLADEDSKPLDSSDAPLTIAGTEGMVVSYGRCCSPIP